MTRITPDSPEIKKLKDQHRSGMFLRVGSSTKTSHVIHFSWIASESAGLKKLDKVCFNDAGQELWIGKSEDGFQLAETNKGTLIIYSKALVDWLSKRYRMKPPFRLWVFKAGENLSIRNAEQMKVRKRKEKEHA